MKTPYRNIINRVPIENDLENDWLEPSEKSWDSIKKKTPIGKKEKVHVFIPLAIVFLIAVIPIGLVSFNENNLENAFASTDDQIEVNSRNNHEKQFTQPNINTTENINNNTEESKNKAIKNKSTLNNNTVNTNLIADKNTNKKSSKAGNKFVMSSYMIDSQADLLMEENTVENNLITKKELPIVILESESNNTHSLINNNKTDFLTPLNFSLLLDNKKFDLTPSIKTLNPNINKWAIGILAAYTPLKEAVNHISIVRPLEETIKDESYQEQRSFGLEINRKLSQKWSLSLQPNIILDNLTTTYSLDIPYDFNSEMVNNNLNVNNFSHSLPTDVGSTTTDLVVTRKSNSTILHNENVNYTLKIKHNLATLSLPVIAKYKLLNYKNSSISINLGPNLEYQLFSKVNTELLESHHDDIDTHSISLNDNETVRNLGIGLNMGTEYNYKVNNSTEIGLSINYTKLLIEANRQNRNNLQLVVRKSL